MSSAQKLVSTVSLDLSRSSFGLGFDIPQKEKKWWLPKRRRKLVLRMSALNAFKRAGSAATQQSMMERLAMIVGD